MSKKIVSPCIDVCKFKRQGHCIGCSMTKAQKTLYKNLKKTPDKRAFIELLSSQQSQLGRYEHWEIAYAKKCLKKGADNPVAKKATASAA
jgi:predicted Fe-S protein YdhL (DUF1289 family)